MTITPSSRRWSSPVIRNTYALPSIYLTPNQRRGVESGSPVQCQVEAVHQESSLEEQFVSCVVASVRSTRNDFPTSAPVSTAS